MYVIGTAGHVDHGKSTLIKALTGINPDRLAEEQERQMTIDLGFAWHTLPSGEEIGIVDVPGHRDFIDNMLAGVGGIDLVLFVVAADEGIMPQSREHLNIVKLLGIKHGLIVLTKTDLVPDLDWLSLVEADVRDLVKGSFLESAPMIKTSVVKGEGLEELSQALDEILPKINKNPSISSPRLPIDRVFSLRGFGTIVTGTLTGGSFSIGDEIVILPSNIETRIRGIQTHKKKQTVAQPGNRTAINLIGVEVKEIQRGEMICKPGAFSPTNILDIEIKVLQDFSDALRHDDEVKVFLGTDQKMARVRVLGQDEIDPGHTGYVQLMIAGSVVAVEGDRMILRRPSPPATIGGGSVVNASPKQRYKRFSQEILDRLAIHASGSIAERVYIAVSDMQFAEFSRIKDKMIISDSDLCKVLDELIEKKQIIVFTDNLDDSKRWYIATDEWERIKEKVLITLKQFHRENKLLAGANQAFLNNILGVEKRFRQVVLPALIRAGLLIEENKLFRLPGFSISLSKEQDSAINELVERFNNAGYQPPSAKEVIEIIGEDLFQYLIDSKRMVALSDSVIFLPSQIQEITKKTIDLLTERTQFTVADFRDYLDTSRKYAVALLEFMDRKKVTQRKGDIRVKYAG